MKRIIKLLALVLVFAFSILTLSKSGAIAVFYSRNTKKLPIYSVKTSEKKIAISFDCAWGTDYTDTLLKVMQEIMMHLPVFGNIIIYNEIARTNFENFTRNRKIQKWINY